MSLVVYMYMHNYSEVWFEEITMYNDLLFCLNLSNRDDSQLSYRAL